MPSKNQPAALPETRTVLLLEAVELLVEELGVLAAQRWEKVPELKRKKVVAACRLRQVRAESEAADGAPVPALESLIEDLEMLSQGQIRARLSLIGNQMLALQELSLYLRETERVNLRGTTHRPLGNADLVS